MEIELHPGAQQDLREAATWYAERDPEVASDFIAIVDHTLRGLASDPKRWPGHRRFGFRRVIMRRFPYAIYYEVKEERILVLAFAHHKRRPAYWISRSGG